MSIGTTPVGSDERWRLLDEADFLQRSLADADSEHLAGDLSDLDHAALRRRDEARLTDVRARLATLEARPSNAPANARSSRRFRRFRLPRPRGRRRTLVAVVGFGAIAVAVVLMVMDLASPRLPGESSSGTVTLDRQQQVAREMEQAAVLVNRGSLVAALEVYQAVLRQDPKQPEALAERGWLEYEAGVETHEPSVVAQGRASVERAVQVQPNGYPGHLYLGTIELQQDHDPATAVGEYRLFLSEDPPQQLVDQSAPFLRQAFTEDGQPVPVRVPPSSGAPTG